MNVIFLHYSYGYASMRMTVEKMQQPVTLVAKTKAGENIRYNVEKKCWVTLDESLTKYLHPSNNVINWGNHIFSNDDIFRLNVPSAVALASNKAKARFVLQNMGVAVPKTHFLGQNWAFAITGDVIARPPKHHGGKNFHVLHDANDFWSLAAKNKGDLSGWYFAELFQKTHEFRVHCAHGKILQISNKPLIPGEIRANQAVTEESWKALKWSEYDSILPVCQEALKAVEILGLDYGAVDVMWNAETEKAAVCEVNTSPSINTEYSSGKYAAYFDWVIRHNFPAHFPMEGKSVFYNKILES